MIKATRVTDISLSKPVLSRRTRYGERGRDPYDSLRPWSAITHGVGAVLALLGTALLLYWRVQPAQRVAFAIYGATMVLLYLASTLYHCIRTGVRGRILLRKLDHCSIYLLIAGSYTPVCLLGLAGWPARALLLGIWLAAAIGIALSLLWIGTPRWLTAGSYLLIGWLGVAALPLLYQAMSSAAFFWLMLGAAFYTLGGVLYALKWPGRSNPHFGCHEIFHIFILAGSICHWDMMLAL